MSYLSPSIVPTVTPTIAQTTKYQKNSSNMIKYQLNKISIAQTTRGK